MASILPERRITKTRKDESTKKERDADQAYHFLTLSVFFRVFVLSCFRDPLLPGRPTRRRAALEVPPKGKDMERWPIFNHTGKNPTVSGPAPLGGRSPTFRM
jgi:hypothetical protein